MLYLLFLTCLPSKAFNMSLFGGGGLVMAYGHHIAYILVLTCVEPSPFGSLQGTLLLTIWKTLLHVW